MRINEKGGFYWLRFDSNDWDLFDVDAVISDIKSQIEPESRDYDDETFAWIFDEKEDFRIKRILTEHILHPVHLMFKK